MLLVIVAYLCGAIPGGYVLNRLVWQRLAPHVARALADRRGAALLLRVVPRALSVMADFCIGALVTLALASLAAHLRGTRWEWTTQPLVSDGLVHGATLIALVVGHALSVYICGWGGKGIAMAMGGFMVLTPIPSLIAISVFCLVTGLTRRIGVGGVAGTLALLLAIWQQDHSALVYSAVAGLLCCYSVLVHAVDILPDRHDKA
jgi:glycerol-3-phosphate acyltransferase PlsY